jgi:WD40 repeat protein
LKVGKDNQIGGVSATDKYFVVGTSNFTQIFEKTSRKKVLDLQGHSSASFMFAHDDKYILTASNENFMNLFDTTLKSSTPIQILSLEDYPVSIDMKVNGELVDILAVTQKGNCFIWRIKKFGKKGLKSDGKIIKNGGVIITAKFNSENEISIATGSNLNPFFENIVEIFHELTFSRISLKMEKLFHSWN